MHRKPHIRRPFLSSPTSSSAYPLLLRVVMASFVSLPFLLLLFLLSSPFSSPPPSLAAPHSPRHARIPRPSPAARPAPTKPPSASSSSSAALFPVIAQACNATRFPDSCQSTLTSAGSSLPPNPSATDLILASLSASSSALRTAQANAEAIRSASSADPNRTNAANNCVGLLGYSSRRLAQATSVVARGDPRHVDDARAWAGAALLYQYDCWSALKYVNGTKQVDDAMWFLLSLEALTSNALSMLFSLRRFGSDMSLWRPPQTERDGYWQDDATAAVTAATSRSALYSLPTDLTPDATVCKNDGSSGSACSYSTVQAAVDAAPGHGTSRFVIYIKAGVYTETVRVAFEKTNVAFVGDGMGKTVITGSLNAQMVGVSTYNTATVGVSGDGFMARDITFENTAGPDAHQAVAYRSDSDLSVLQSVEFLGHQDTLYAHSLRQLYNACRIVGTVDFVFGNSASVFQDSLLLVQPRQVSPDKGETNAVTAHGRTDPAQPTGFVFRGCVVNGTDDYMALYRQKPAVHKNYLGRPWKEYSRTVFLQCYLGEIVRPEGWLPWDGNFALQTLFYGEYQSSGPGAANSSARVSWSSQIPAEHVGAYSVEKFIQGDQWLPTVRRR